MADRFSGTVYLGGRVKQEHYEKCKELLDGCLDDELDEDGSGAFVECVRGDFDELVAYCQANNIALSLLFDAKWEYPSTVEYWVSGKHKQYLALEGDVAIKLDQLGEHKEKTIADFIAQLEIPDFPALEVLEDDFCTNHLEGDALKVAKVVLSVLGDNPYGGGCRAFWTPEEWIARNEEFGTDSVLVLVHDGGDLAPACNWDYEQYELSERLRIALEEVGFYYEQCTCWYSAVYRLPVAI